MPEPVKDDFRAYARALIDSWGVKVSPAGQQIIADAFRADDRMKAGRRPAA